jgi:hypothetical protein
MFYGSYIRSAKCASFAAALLSGTACLPLFAVPAIAQTSANSTADLVNLLVKRGVISRKDAEAFLRQTNDEAASARPPASRSAAAASPPAAASVTTMPPNDGAMHVTYVPETVRQQMKAELRQEVMQEARAEHWAAPDNMPAWTQRLHLFGDLRTRYEGDFFPSGNDNTGAFPNFNAINTGAPFDTSNISNPNFPPEYNVDKNRNRFRLQLRFGLDANLGDDFNAAFRIGTGSDNQPVSLNQSLGGNGGDFSKYQIWLDRAYLKYTPTLSDRLSLEANVGRFPNPFMSTDLIFDSDLNFDGAALRTDYQVGSRLGTFVTVGGFPIFNTDLNFASNQPSKFSSDDRYLLAAQAGFDWKINHDYGLRFAAAFYDYDNIAGRLSSPCTVLSAADACDTDAMRPSFAQRGNTYMSLRQIVPTANNNFGTTDQFQYYGLASRFQDVSATAHLDLNHFDPFHIGIDAEFVENVAFDKVAMEAIALNNRGPVPTGGTIGTFDGGNVGYYVRGLFGSQELEHRWDWNFSVGYKYLESDAVVDGLTDADFGLGGTNLKGYILGGSLALSSNVYAGVHWFSADSIAGSPYAADVFQFDIGTKF